MIEISRDRRSNMQIEYIQLNIFKTPSEVISWIEAKLSDLRTGSYWTIWATLSAEFSGHFEQNHTMWVPAHNPLTLTGTRTPVFTRNRLMVSIGHGVDSVPGEHKTRPPVITKH